MNETINTTSEDLLNSNISTLITIPEGYKVSCWKVSDGSVVRSGETVALLIPNAIHNDIAGGDPILTDPSIEASGSHIEKSSHKRPSRRKRPATAQPVATHSSDSNRPSTDDAPIVHNDPKTRTLGIPINSTAVKHSDFSVRAIQAPVDGIFRRNKSVTPQRIGDVEIGFIIQCQHPTVVSGLCAVCGIVLSNSNSTDDNGVGAFESTNTDSAQWSSSQKPATRQPCGMTVMTVSGMTLSVSKAESKRMAQEDTQRLHLLRKLSLVLDLDHTLLHATADPRAELQCHRSDVRRLVLPFMTMDMNPFKQPQQHNWLQHHYIKLRPHVKDFLELAMQHFEIGVYTAGTREYAEEIAMILARHLVGAERDQFDLDRLHQHLAHSEHLYLRQQRTWNNSEPKEVEAKPSPAVGVASDANDTMPVDGIDYNKVASEIPASTKRKRVQFGVTPVDTRTDEISEEFIVKLRKDVNEADRLEQRALEMRQKLFGSRVMSRTEAGEMGRHVKSLKRIFPCGGSMAAVIDDREDVWANAAEDMGATRRRGEPPENLLLVRPYHWSLFHGFADVNNASGMDFLGSDVASETETDEQLLWTAIVLKTLHERYYSCNGPNRPTVPDILEQMRRSVLQGCKIVLSGLVPLAKQNDDPSQPRPSFVRYAESLGSEVHSSVSNSVTHVVAAKDGTDKILAARRINGCYVVKPSWLIECFWSLTHRDETAHLLGMSSKPVLDTMEHVYPKEKADLCTVFVDSPEMTSNGFAAESNNDEDDEDDEDFAAELGNELMNNVAREQTS